MEKQPLKLDQTWANALVSEGTLRTPDLITKFSGVLLNSNENNKIFFHDVLIYDWVDVISFLDADDLSAEQLQDQHDFLQYLTSILEVIAPDGCSFTTLDGDGAQFGFWRNNEKR
jgi:hypothetical protein